MRMNPRTPGVVVPEGGGGADNEPDGQPDGDDDQTRAVTSALKCGGMISAA
jgi:hypothetical protein